MNLRSAPSPLLLSLGLMLAVPRGSAAAAEATELLALHPCVVTGEKDPAKVQNYQLACATELARGDVQLAPSEQVRALLEKEPKQSCSGPNAKRTIECLGRLASATQSGRAVLVTLSPGPLTRVSGLVVNPRGDVLDQKNVQLRNRGQSDEAVVQTALSRLREQLDLIPVKLPSLVQEPPPPPAPAVAAAEPPTLTPPSRSESVTAPGGLSVHAERSPLLGQSWKTPVAYTAAGLGVAAFAVAGVLAVQGDAAMKTSNTYFANGSYPLVQDVNTIYELRNQASSKRLLAGVSTGVGAALVGAGVYLWIKDRPVSPQPGLAAVSAGPGGVSLLGVLP
jgi:hypothetical protein